MVIPAPTPLEALPDLPEEMRQRLRCLWIESVEEYVSLLTAVTPRLWKELLGTSETQIQDTRRRAVALIGRSRARQLLRPAKVPPTGCLVDPETLKKVEGGMGIQRRLVTAPAPRKLPLAVRLMKKLRPPGDQGDRSTCVAFATAALREFLNGDGTALSEQFLYWACKAIDGAPSQDGTFLHTSLAALGSHGICKGRTWPYSGEMVSGNVAQGPPPAGAEEEALRYRMMDSRPVENGCIELCKQVLAGTDEVPGMPIVVAALLFDSWEKSPETARTGKITMPLPKEAPSGAHAMCIVGYVDNQNVPGGGYFILRNSWGNRFAQDSPEAPGHAMMAYAYAVNYITEAFTGPAGAPLKRVVAAPEKLVAAPAPKEVGEIPEMARYTRLLGSPARDLDGKLLEPGTAVLFNPLSPDEVMEDTPANRREFGDRHHAWSDATRRRVLLPATDALPKALDEQLAAAKASRDRFVAIIENNLRDAVGDEFPEANPPYKWYLLPFDPRIKHVAREADLTDELIGRMKELSRLPKEISWPAEWDKMLGGVEHLRVFSIDGPSAHIDVVAGFCTSLGFLGEDSPGLHLEKPGPAAIEAMRSVYREWAKRSGRPRPQYTFFTVGSLLEWGGQTPAANASEGWIFSYGPQNDGIYTTSIGQRPADPVSVRLFIDRLRPETREEHIAHVKGAIDELMESGYEGNIRVAKLARDSGYDRLIVRDAMFALQDSGEYRVYKLDDGQLAIDRKVEKPKRVTREAMERGRGFRVMLTLVAVLTTLGVWLVRDLMMQRHFTLWAVGLLLPLVYCGRLADRRLSKLLEAKE